MDAALKAGDIIYYKPIPGYGPDLERRATVKRLVDIEPNITMLLIQPIREGSVCGTEFIFLGQVTRKEGSDELRGKAEA